MSTNKEDAERWIERGNGAWRKVNLAETTRCFGNAVAADPESVEARLGFGVANSFLYVNGCNDARSLLFEPMDQNSPRPNMQERSERATAAQAEQNATYGRVAEENLLAALRLDDCNTVALLYLGDLYQQWVSDIDTLGRATKPRQNEAIQSYTRVLEVNPEDPRASYARGALVYEMATSLISPSTRPTMTTTEEIRGSVQEQVDALLDQSFEDLSRARALNPNDQFTLMCLSHIKRLRGLLKEEEEKPGEVFLDRARDVRSIGGVGTSMVFRRAVRDDQTTAVPQKRCFPPEQPVRRRPPPLAPFLPPPKR